MHFLTEHFGGQDNLKTLLAQPEDSIAGIDGAPKMLAGTGKKDTHLIVACTADRGLCGGFNSSIAREVRKMVINLKAEGKTVKILCIGRKGRDNLKRDYESNIIDTIEGIGKSSVEYTEATDVADRITAMFDEDDFDICTIVFNCFQSAMTQIPTAQQLIPFAAPEAEEEKNGETAPKATDEGPFPIFIFEPEEQDILSELLPRNMGVQVFQALLESAASEHGARMTSMDNATRNAGDMIDKLSIIYNRTRQAAITTELVEIVSGAEALK